MKQIQCRIKWVLLCGIEINHDIYKALKMARIHKIDQIYYSEISDFIFRESRFAIDISKHNSPSKT